jgi:CRP-like cAMP-binding protein
MIQSSILEELPLFSNLEQQTLRSIAERSFVANYASGHTLVIEGMPAEFGYYILSGHVRALRMNREGRIQVLARFTASSPVNVISLLTSPKTNRATLETIAPTKALVMDTNTFEWLLTHHPDFSSMILREMANRMSKMTDLAADLSLHTVRTRLARFLIDLSIQPTSSPGWTQDEIAAHIGTVRDVVGRLMRQFELEGLISRDRQQIAILDRSGLLAEAESQE